MDWYYAEAGQQRGPVSESEFQDLIRAGKISGETLVWREGMVNWQAYRELASAAGSSVPPPSKPQPASGFPAPGSSPEQARQLALDKVNGPAVGLMVTAVFGFLAALATAAFSFAGARLMPPNMAGEPSVELLTRMTTGVVGLLNALVVVALSALTLAGALRMKRLESYGLAMAAAIVAVFPCTSPCCFLGVPIGIWALVIMNRPEVKSQFQ